MEIEEVLTFLTAAKVNIEQLKYMNADDIKEAVPPLGLRIGFRQKLFRWKESEGGDEDRIAPLPSFVKPDVKAPLKFILNKSGMKILEHEETHLYLPQVLRDEHISIIIEEAMLEHITNSVPDFQALLEEICFVLPSQINVKIDIDFDRMYPAKGFHLLSKWQEFRQKKCVTTKTTSLMNIAKPNSCLLKTAPT
nr:uncharacterized protein LOC118879779 isoform X2 [Drosophila suzukii]